MSRTPIKPVETADSTSLAALVAAMPTVDAERKAAQERLAVKLQWLAGCGAEVDVAKADLQAARAEAQEVAERLGAGEEIDPAEVDSAALKVAVAEARLAIREGAKTKAGVAAQTAGVEELKSRWHCAQRDAKVALRPEGETRIATAAALDVLVNAVEATHAASLARIEAERDVLQLRDELWGVDSSARHHPYSDDQELWRVLMALPPRWLEEIRAHHHTGGVDLRAVGKSLIKRSEA